MQGKIALRFVLLLSFVSFFADMTYESARSITGPYLATLGASAAVVGFVAGFGELIGYALRLVSGYFADKSKRYWTITIWGYVCNLLAVPLLALANHWWLAATLIILERAGKAIRVPPRDAMLSYAGSHLRLGWIFGLHEAIDQLGAMIGPLLVAVVLYYKGGYQESFALLLIPALLALMLLSIARWLYPKPHDLSVAYDPIETKNMQLPFWIYLVGSAFVAAGYADFPLIAFHFQKTALITPVWIPVFYAVAMGINGVSSPLCGILYDKKGLIVLIVATLLSCFFAPLVFLGSAHLAFLGILLWSIGVSAHETLMRAIVAKMVTAERRASAYGVFNAVYGIAWFVGSFLMGIIYDISLPAVVAFSLILQLLALPFFWIVMRKIK